MGMFDTIIVGNRSGQVKCFEDPSMRVFEVADEVGPLGGEHTYSISMDCEGGYVNVKFGLITSWTDKPRYTRIHDKWGYIKQRES